LESALHFGDHVPRSSAEAIMAELGARRSFSIVDAFAAQPYSGNRVAVLVLDAAVGTTWIQAVTMEFNLAETAFVQRRDDGAWRLRWFTPVREVRLYGHATPAAAHVLWT
jgi:PhzF family phenazine biosynthesis protein